MYIVHVCTVTMHEYSTCTHVQVCAQHAPRTHALADARIVGRYRVVYRRDVHMSTITFILSFGFWVLGMTV